MNFKKSFVERYYLSDSLTYADIYISDDGALSIRSDYGDYIYKWNSFGDNFKNFLISIGDDYLINKLGCGNSYIFDFDSTIKAIKLEIIKERKEKNISIEEAREIWDQIENLDNTDNKDMFFRDIIETKYFELLCYNDCYNIPCNTVVNPQLYAFVKEIWPFFIKELKVEIK